MQKEKMIMNIFIQTMMKYEEKARLFPGRMLCHLAAFKHMLSWRWL